VITVKVFYGARVLEGSQMEKVTEHQSYQSSHVNGAIGALVAGNLVAILPWSKLWQKILFRSFGPSGIVLVG
jgi:hypothetical protein